MAYEELTNIGFVIVGGFTGSLLMTLFPYFMEKQVAEKQRATIRAKPPEQRTPEEQYILSAEVPGFLEEYKWRFGFGLLAGIGSVIAFLQTGLGDIQTMTPGGALFAGITASGFLSALADKIRSSGEVVVNYVKPPEPQPQPQPPTA